MHLAGGEANPSPVAVKNHRGRGTRRVAASLALCSAADCRLESPQPLLQAKLQPVVLHAQPQQLSAIGCDAALEAAVASQQVVGTGTLVDVPLDRERVADQAGLDCRSVGVREAALVVVDAAGVDKIVKAADGLRACSDPQQLDFARGESFNHEIA